MITSDTLIDIETCDRRAAWSREWEPERLHPTTILYRAIEKAITDTEREDVGQLAGEIVMEFAAERGFDVGDNINRYDCALHHAALADILTTYLRNRYRKPLEWVEDRAIGNLSACPKALRNGRESLVRPILVDHLSDERIAAESHSWHTLLPLALYEMPMCLEFIVLGQSRSGRRHSAWSTGFCHPRNHALRFQKQTDKRGLGSGFADSWRKVWREEVAQIEREDWIKAMVADGMVGQLTKRVTVNPLPQKRRADVLALVSRKLSNLSHSLPHPLQSLPVESRIPSRATLPMSNTSAPKGLPDPSYSACDWPRPCPFQRCCYSEPERTPEEAGGFVQLDPTQ